MGGVLVMGWCIFEVGLKGDMVLLCVLYEVVFY